MRCRAVAEADQNDTDQISLNLCGLPEQYSGMQKNVEQVTKLAIPIRPRVVIGGSAVKLGLIPPILGAELMADIKLLI